MKRLILVRHGAYREEDLTEIGRDQIKRLAEVLRSIVKESSVLIMSSPKIRAEQTAQIIADALNVSFESNEAFDEFGSMDWLEEAVEMIDSKKDEAESIIITTHSVQVAEIPSTFSNAVWATKIHPRNLCLEYGQAWVLNCEDNTIQRIPD